MATAEEAEAPLQPVPGDQTARDGAVGAAAVGMALGGLQAAVATETKKGCLFVLLVHSYVVLVGPL